MNNKEREQAELWASHIVYETTNGTIVIYAGTLEIAEKWVQDHVLSNDSFRIEVNQKRLK